MNKVVINCSTGKEEIIPLTAEEIAQKNIDAQNQPQPLPTLEEEVKALKLLLADVIGGAI